MKNRYISILFISSILLLASCQKQGQRKDCLVTFQNFDGFALYSTTVKSGDSVTYKGPDPIRNSAVDTLFYRFTGWDKPLTNIRSDTTFTALYYQGNRYKATFMNEDLILQDDRFDENTTPSYNGATPTKDDETDMGIYVFSGWSPELAPIIEDTIYHAQYTYIDKTSFIVLDNEDNQDFNSNLDYPREYFELVDNPNTLNNEIAEYMYHNSRRGGFNGAVGYQVSWTTPGNTFNSFVVDVATDSNINNIVLSQAVENENSTYLFNLAPGRYYYRVREANNNGYSVTQSLNITNRLRTIYAGNELSNMRDIGGYKTYDNKHIKYGFVFRNNHMVNARGYTDNLFKNVLGIKTELDIRFNTDKANYDESYHPIDGVSYKHFGLTDAYPYMITHTQTIANIKKIFELLVAENTFPISFHCTNGADRTGLLALLIEGALGICDEDIYRDYELTSFCAASNYYQPRCDIVVDNQNYSFRSDGYRTDTWGNGSFEKVILDMKASYSNASASISETVCNFLINKCGVTETQINTLKALLLEN